MLRSFVFSGLAILMVQAIPRPAAAQDASFGCKVLLCAAASNPSWSGIPYCVPVMTQLFRMLRRGASWPVCPEGHASGLGYEPYFPCPSPMVAYSGRGERGSAPYEPDENGSYCADPSRMQRECQSFGDNGPSCDPLTLMVPRSPRTDASFVDITTGGQTTRFYFSLRGY